MTAMSKIIENPDKTMTTTQAAEYIGVSKATLDCWRSTKRRVIKFYKIGRNVRYKRSDLDEYIESCAVTD